MKMRILLIFLIFLIHISLFSFEDCQDSVVDTTIKPPPSSYYNNVIENLTIIEIDESSGAKCSDGSIYKILYVRGSGDGINKFIFYLEGSGYCGYENSDFLISCLNRQSDFTGSSDSYGSNGSIYQQNYSLGYMSSDHATNPLFWNWNKITFLYCDGTLFQGFLSEPIKYNGSDIWIRGYNNTYGSLEYMRKNLGLFDAEEVILTGSSSGAQSALIWMNFLRDYLPNNIKLKGILDAGLFLDIKNINSNCYLFRSHMKNMINMTNSHSLDLLFKYCQYYNKTDEFWKCLLAEYIIEDIHIPMFFINSQNDFENMRTVYGLHCLADGLESCDKDVNEKIFEFRQEFLKFAFKIISLNITWGFWFRRCIEHIYIYSLAWKGNFTSFNANINEETDILKALSEWYIHGNYSTYIDLNDFQHNCPIYS